MPRVPRILAIANQKGGVGKTTTAINLAASLAAAELPTLLVDCDPQGNATSGLGVAPVDGQPTLYQVLSGEAELAAALRTTALDGLEVVPASRDLVGLNLELAVAEARELRLARALVRAPERLRFIVLDCPPALDLLTLNALTAAQAVIIPMQCEYFALEGLAQLLDTIAAVQARWNPGLEIAGVLLNQFEERTHLSRQVTAELRRHFGARIFRTTVPRNVRLAEAPSFGQPALLYDVRSKGSEAFLQLAREVIERELAQSGTQSIGAGA
ncbi:MAG: ParA family protein [Terriglobales bacterium]